LLRLCYTIIVPREGREVKTKEGRSEKKIKKPLDKPLDLWYNIITKRKDTSQTRKDLIVWLLV